MRIQFSEIYRTFAWDLTRNRHKNRDIEIKTILLLTQSIIFSGWGRKTYTKGNKSTYLK